MATFPTAAIIGAGSSGIAAAKALHERGVPFTCFEAADAERARRQGFGLPVPARGVRERVPA
jgi:cation diffusion facilitator CzcD-associated flavoprotein CzcO